MSWICIMKHGFLSIVVQSNHGALKVRGRGLKVCMLSLPWSLSCERIFKFAGRTWDDAYGKLVHEVKVQNPLTVLDGGWCKEISLNLLAAPQKSYCRLAKSRYWALRIGLDSASHLAQRSAYIAESWMSPASIARKMASSNPSNNSRRWLSSLEAIVRTNLYLCSNVDGEVLPHKRRSSIFLFSKANSDCERFFILSQSSTAE